MGCSVVTLRRLNYLHAYLCQSFEADLPHHGKINGARERTTCLDVLYDIDRAEPKEDVQWPASVWLTHVGKLVIRRERARLKRP